MKRKLILTGIGLLGIYFTLSLVDLGYSHYLKKQALFSGEVQQWNEVKKGELKTDLAIFGSSRAFIHVNPKILAQKLDQKVYNFGLNGSKFGMQYYRFKQFLKYNPSPKTIVWVLDSFSFSKIDKLYQPNQYVPFMLFNDSLYQQLKPYPSTHLLDFIVPLWRYRDQSYWKDEVRKSQKLQKEGLYRYKGFRSYNRQWSVNLDELPAKLADFDQHEYVLLDEMINRCEAEKIQLIFVIAPEFIQGQHKMLNRDLIINRYKNTLAHDQLPFIDYSTDSLSYKKSLFYNSTHMNASGADAFSKELADDLLRILKEK